MTREGMTIREDAMQHNAAQHDDVGGHGAATREDTMQWQRRRREDN